MRLSLFRIPETSIGYRSYHWMSRAVRSHRSGIVIFINNHGNLPYIFHSTYVVRSQVISFHRIPGGGAATIVFWDGTDNPSLACVQRNASAGHPAFGTLVPVFVCDLLCLKCVFVAFQCTSAFGWLRSLCVFVSDVILCLCRFHLLWRALCHLTWLESLLPCAKCW